MNKNKWYVGESLRPVRKRIIEHDKDVSGKKIITSGISKHCREGIMPLMWRMWRFYVLSL